MVSQSFDDISIRQSVIVDEGNSAGTADPFITQAVTGMFLSPTTVSGRDTVSGLPVVASNEYGKLEYATVADVEQATSITTAVTANGQAGVITTQSATSTLAAPETFTVNNSSVTAESAIFLQIMAYSGTLSANEVPLVYVDSAAAGSFDIIVANAGAGSLDGTLEIAYQVVG